MPFSLKTMLKMPDFIDFFVLAGKNGLARTVTSVTVMDAPDISEWLKGGEILMTTGYIMRDNPLEFANLVEKIDQANAAAMFIKMERFIDSLPQEVYTVAEKLNFPIVSMPISFAFTDVITPVLTEIVNEQARSLRISENIHRSFTNLVLNGGKSDEIIHTLSNIINSSCAYIDLKHAHICIAAKSSGFEKDIQTRNIQYIISKYKNHPVRIGKKNYGYIIYESGSHSTRNYNSTAVQHAATVLKLSIQQKISNEEIENRHKTEFVRDLISGVFKNAEEIKSKSSLYDWNAENGVIVAILEIDHYEDKKDSTKKRYEIVSIKNLKEQIFEACIAKMNRNFDHMLTTPIRNSIIFLISPKNGDDTKTYEELLQSADSLRTMVREQCKVTITVGVGEYHASVLETPDSYAEATQSIKIGRKLHEHDSTVTYRKLGVYRLLGPIYNTPEAKEFCSMSLGALERYDKDHGADLLNTLICLKESNWNLKHTAEKLFIHYNTIKYRYKQIEKILNIDLEDSDNRFNISISIKLLFLRQSLSAPDCPDIPQRK